MSVEGPSYATGPSYTFDDVREAGDSTSERSSAKSSNFVRETAITSAFIANFKGPPSPLEICLPVIQGTEDHPQNHEIFQSNYDPNSPSVVTNRVNLIVQRWGRVVPVHPVEFLKNILRKRGYREDFVPALSPEVRRPPTFKQLEDYDNEIVWAIRNSDLKKLDELRVAGKSLSACNRYSESVVHMACRRAEKEIVQFLIQHSADLSIVDDYGRTPLHDACWRPEPRFDIVTMILDVNADLIRLADMRGSIALNYVREEHWVLWCAYLFNQIEKYWPLRRSNSLDAEHLAKRQRIDESMVC